MTLLWIGVCIAITLASAALYLQIVDHRLLRRLWLRIRYLENKIREWEGWGRLVCAIAADKKLEIPDPPTGIDEPIK